MKRAFLLSTLVGLLLTPALSACQNSPVQLSANRLSAQAAPRSSAAIRSDEGLRKGVIELRKVRFSKWDKNVNGVLTRDEVSDENMALPGVISGFKDYDVNNDGQITQAEFLRAKT
jgi:Ca2+-binding EF-hand superfamily protein